MCRRRDEIHAETGRLDEDDPHIAGFSAVAIDLEHRILLFPVRTSEGLAEKKRIVAAVEIEVDSNHMIWSVGCDIVEFIYKLDAERIAATA